MSLQYKTPWKWSSGYRIKICGRRDRQRSRRKPKVAFRYFSKSA